MSDLESPRNPLPDEDLPAPEPQTLEGPVPQPDGDALAQEAAPAAIEGESAGPEQEPVSSSAEAPAPPPEGALSTPATGQAARRPELSSLMAAILLIALGVILLWPALSGGMILVPGRIVLGAAGGLAAVLVAYWRDRQRQAYGAFFLGMLSLLWGALGCWMVLEPGLGGGFGRTWSLFVALLGSAILLTAAANRRQTARLLPPGLILTTIGVAAATVLWGLLPEPVFDLAVQAGPWILVALAVGLLPLAFRRSGHRP
jgi:uncharacterized membrane protein (UPF0136 family)